MKVRFRPEAAAELLQARDWYAGRDSGLGDEFVAAVDGAVDRVVANPLAFAVLPRVPSVRRAQLRRFPFVLLFRALVGEVIEVIALAQRDCPSHRCGNKQLSPPRSADVLRYRDEFSEHRNPPDERKRLEPTVQQIQSAFLIALDRNA